MKIAVVGSGVSGLAATWLLNEHSEHEVTLIEADSRIGGHANTVRYIPPGKEEKDGVDVDTGFIVFNPSTYPNFLRFLKSRPGVKILPTEMTFSVSRDKGQFEWAGSNLATIFCQPSRLLDPSMWRLIYDVLRFNACARRLVIGWERGKEGEEDELSIGDYLDANGYSASFRDNYLIPMTACIWSTPPDKCALDFPARTLVQFLNNHHLLQITGKPDWLTLQHGSRTYVNSIIHKLPKGTTHLSSPVEFISTHNSEPGVFLKTANEKTTKYDHVILACHSDTALSILKAGEGATAREEEILSRFRWSQNEVVLHCDADLMPRSKLAWSCWNYLTHSVTDESGVVTKSNNDQVALTYGMNDLQHLPEKEHGPILVTLNPPFKPREDKTFSWAKYEHPIIDGPAVRSQHEITEIQGTRGISYAGAWLRYGFHEDGFTSGMNAVLDHIPGVTSPFDVQYAEKEPKPVLVAPFFDLFEKTQLRRFCGVYFSWCLVLLRACFGVLFDLSHIGAEERRRKIQ